MSCCSDKSFYYHIEAAEILAGLAASLEICLNSYNDKVAFPAVVKLLGMGRSGPAIVNRLAECLQNHGEESRLGIASKDVSDNLLQVVNSWLATDNIALRSGSAELLVEIGRVDEPVIEALISCIDPTPLPYGYKPPPEWDPRFRALNILFDVGKDDHRVAAKVESWLAVEDFYIQLQMADFLVEKGRFKAAVVRSLERCLASDDLTKRLVATTFLLRRLKRADLPVVEVVRSCLDAKAYDVLSEAIGELAAVGFRDPVIAAGARECLNSEDPAIRVKAIRLLELVNEVTDSDLDALLPCFESKDIHLRLDAAGIMIRQKRTAPWLVKGLLGGLEERYFYSTKECLRLLLDLSRLDTDVLDDLLRAIDLQSKQGARAVLRILERQPLEPGDTDALRELVTQQQSEEPQRKRYRQLLFDWIREEVLSWRGSRPM